MIKFSATLALGLLLCFCVLPAHSIYCKIDTKKDLATDHPLLLQTGADEFYYPKKAGSNKLYYWQKLRVACPQQDLQVYSRNLRRIEGNLKCLGGNVFRLQGSFVGAPLRNIACGTRPTAVSTLTGATCPNGVLARIGFRLRDSKYANVIDRICHTALTGRTNWVHHRVPSVIRARETDDTVSTYSTGPFYSNINIGSPLFTRDSQRARLMTLLTEATRVDAIMPATSTNILEETMLAPRDDMFYREQQEATFFYANTVPVWSTIKNNNWRQVETIVRGLAAARGSLLDVYTGGIDDLTYARPAAAGEMGDQQVAFTLTTNTQTMEGAVPVPLYLFKYVLDRTRNEALAFVTVNNPQADTTTLGTICTVHADCATRYPEFTNTTNGFTYCCLVTSTSEFGQRARGLGMPVLANVKAMDLTRTAAANTDTEGWVPLLGAFPNFILDKFGVQLSSTSTTEATDE